MPEEEVSHISNASPRHLNNVKKGNLGVVKSYRCEICSYPCTKPSYLEMHKAGKRHLQRVAQSLDLDVILQLTVLDFSSAFC